MVVGLFYLLCFLLLGLGVNGEIIGSSERLKSHPFLSDTCVNLITADLTTPPNFPKHDIYIVLPLYNPNDPQLVVQAVKSILSDAKTNYQPYNINLKNLIIVDDNSDSSISAWTVWKSFTENELKILKFLRYSLHQGKVKAKNGAVRYLRDKYSIQGDSALLIFMDVPSVVSPRWLFPLTLTLNKYEKALVYPSFNIISTLQPSDSHYVEGGVNYVVAKGGDLVASFDWDFSPRWESIHDSNRLKHTSTKKETPSSIEWVSPTVPLVFAISWNHFHFLDKFDETLFESSFFVHENIDLSLRNWLCEGIIIQQTCSQIAVAYDYSTNKDFTPAALGPKITKDHIDQNIINLALRYFSINIPEKMKQNFIENHKKGSNEDQSKTEEREYVLQKILEKFYQEKKLREISYEKRFLHRIDALVSSDIDPVRTGPYQSFSHHANLPSAICNDFDWFLDEVYPGLYQDGAKVMTEYVAFHDDETHYHQLLQKTFTPIIQSFKQAYQEKYIANILPQSNALTAAQKEEKKFIQDRENTLRRYGPYFLESSSVQANKLSDESAAAPALKHHFDEPVYVKKYHGYTYEELMEQVSMKNREHLQCIDFQDPTSEKFCETTTLNGDPHACQQRKPKVLFACPKMCGFCDRDQENKFCEDFYLMKCPVWKQQGMCGKTDGQFGSITDICRKSCGICVPDYMKTEPLVVKSDNKQENNNPKSDQIRVQQPIVIKREDHPVVKPQPPAAPGGGGDTNDPNSLNAIDVNEKIAHEQYLSDQIPDVFATVNNDVCHLNDRSDGQLLSRIKVHEEYNPLHPSYSIANKVRLFCGIYTLKKSHQTNVKATRNTWAKKCDGFIAFSDERDESIPSINIHHEGLEEYDNMWQKSRSIWKLLAKSFISSYDFFLLGGDDMFYIIENLRYYLSSPEIMKAREERNGLYIGRIFQPPKQVVFNSGGAGYLLDTKALKVLGDNIDTSKCWPHQRGFWEDVNVANCLKLSTENITPYQTRDSYQRERFHPFNPGLQLTYRVPPNPDWYAKYNPDLKIGYECCSEDSISFHYIPEKKLYQLHNYLYHCEHKAKD